MQLGFIQHTLPLRFFALAVQSSRKVPVGKESPSSAPPKDACHRRCHFLEPNLRELRPVAGAGPPRWRAVGPGASLGSRLPPAWKPKLPLGRETGLASENCMGVRPDARTGAVLAFLPCPSAVACRGLRSSS